MILNKSVDSEMLIQECLLNGELYHCFCCGLEESKARQGGRLKGCRSKSCCSKS